MFREQIFEQLMQNPQETQTRSGTATCALCGKVMADVAPQFRPFCGERCQQMDLANWMDERYGMPWESDDGPEREANFEDE